MRQYAVSPGQPFALVFDRARLPEWPSDWLGQGVLYEQDGTTVLYRFDVYYSVSKQAIAQFECADSQLALGVYPGLAQVLGVSEPLTLVVGGLEATDSVGGGGGGGGGVMVYTYGTWSVGSIPLELSTRDRAGVAQVDGTSAYVYGGFLFGNGGNTDLADLWLVQAGGGVTRATQLTNGVGPNVRAYPGLVFDGSYLHLIGGSDGEVVNACDHWRYDPSANSWLLLASSLPFDQTRGFAAHYDGTLFYAQHYAADIYVSDVSGSSWQRVTVPGASSRDFGFCALQVGALWYFYTNGALYSVDLINGEVVNYPSAPIVAQDLSMIEYQGDLFLIGGSPFVLRFNVAAQRWEEVAPQSGGDLSYRNGAVVMRDEWAATVFGGVGPGGFLSDNLWLEFYDA